MRFHLPLFLLLCALPTAAPAGDLLFAFDGGRTARVYDAAGLTLLASPQVVPGARFAVGQPASGGGSRQRIYVIGDGGVTALNSSLQPVGRIAIDGRPAPLQPAAATSDGRVLIVAAGSKAYRIDTARTAVDTTSETGLELAGVALPHGSRHAYLVAADGRTVFRMDVSTGTLDAATTELPAAVEALQAGRATALGERAGFDLGKLSDAFFIDGPRQIRPSEPRRATATDNSQPAQASSAVASAGR